MIPAIPIEIAAFAAAIRNTDRSACERWLRAQGVDRSDSDKVEAAKKQWQSAPFLGDPALRALALRALESARGPLVDGNTSTHMTIWPGKFATENGRHCDTTLAGFAEWLELQAKAIAAKGLGWVACPTTNSDGHRVNDSTTAMHGLALDNDGRGEWVQILGVLDQLNVCYITYQSGGWAPGKPKWHLFLPLAQPIDVVGEEKRAAWRRAYNAARVVLGAVAGLTGEGFDPACDTPCQPVFICERRRVEDPPRQVIWRPGHALDLPTLMRALPAVQEEERRPCVARGPIATRALDDDALEALVDRLAQATSSVPTDRRQLYMALPGALLDRGVDPDDVVLVCESVSERYPRYDYEKHRDNIRSARTTVACYEAGRPYTRIGKLQGGWPAVAKVIDELLPDTFTQMMQAMTAEWSRVAEQRATAARSTAATAPEATAPTPKKRRRSLKGCSFAKTLDKRAKRLRASADESRRLDGQLLQHLVDGTAIAPRGTSAEVFDRALARAFEVFGFAAPKMDWALAINFAIACIYETDYHFTSSTSRVDAVREAFKRGQAAAKKWRKKIAEKRETRRAQALAVIDRRGQ